MTRRIAGSLRHACRWRRPGNCGRPNEPASHDFHGYGQELHNKVSCRKGDDRAEANPVSGIVGLSIPRKEELVRRYVFRNLHQNV